MVITHTINGTEYWTLYQHLQTLNPATDVVKSDEGKTIKKGQQIGTVGNTGRSVPPDPNRGYHLHFEVGTEAAMSVFAMNAAWCLRALLPWLLGSRLWVVPGSS